MLASSEPQAFYKLRWYDEEHYQQLGRQFDFHVALIHDLTFEITRAANYVCDQVREEIDRSFRLDRGVLLVERPVDLSVVTLRLEYRGPERTNCPYPGLDEFLRVRESRDRSVGTGLQPE